MTQVSCPPIDSPSTGYPSTSIDFFSFETDEAGSLAASLVSLVLLRLPIAVSLYADWLQNFILFASLPGLKRKKERKKPIFTSVFVNKEETGCPDTPRLPFVMIFRKNHLLQLEDEQN